MLTESETDEKRVATAERLRLVETKKTCHSVWMERMCNEKGREGGREGGCSHRFDVG
jgi:hypothetical protein